jgi:phosphatidate cytidylyltransferase
MSFFLAGIFIHHILFAFIFQIFMTIAVLEFYNFGKSYELKPSKFFGVVISVLFFTLIHLYLAGYVELKYLILAPAIFLIPMIQELFRKSEKPILNLAVTYFGIIYVAIPISFLNFLVLPKVTNYEFTYKLILGLFMLIWVCDIGAYFIGSKFGKRKLFERVSPKKSWEGAIGGFLFSLAFSYLCYILFGTLSIVEWLIVSVIITVASIFGDLAESMLKRSINLKDSGTIMPGHGGILDRIDSSLFAIPFVIVFLFLIGKI